MSAKLSLGGWQVAQDTCRLPLKRPSKKNFFPNVMALGSSAYAFDGSAGREGSEPIHSERRVETSFSLHEWRSSATPCSAKIKTVTKDRARDARVINVFNLDGLIRLLLLQKKIE